MPSGLKAGFDTWWTRYGNGPRAGLMIHCSLASSAAWSGLARHLSDDLTLTAFDMPGHGRSARWDGHAEIQGLTTEIAADFLRLEAGPADVIGHSFGATVALRLAVDHPGRVRSLTLIEPVFFAVARVDDPALFEDHEAQNADFTAAMTAGDMRGAARAFLALWGDGRGWDKIPPGEQQALSEQMPLIAGAAGVLFEDAAGLLAPGRLARATMPTLLIEGSTSPPIIESIARGVQRRLPDATRVVIDGAGHMAPLTHANAVGAAILRFLRGAVRENG